MRIFKARTVEDTIPYKMYIQFTAPYPTVA